MASESESEKRETLADIVAELRDEAARADMEQYYTLDDAAESMREYANRLEAAWKREREAARAYWTKKCRDTIAEHDRYCSPVGNAAATGEKPDVADAVIAEMRERAKFLRDGRELDIHNSVVVFGCFLDETLADLADRLEAALKRERAAFDCECAGIAELAAKEEEARHKPGNAAAMRDALRALRDASRDFYNQILNSKYSEILDKYTCVKQGFPAVLDLRSAFPMANAALSAPPRKGKWENGTKYEYEYAYCSECGRMQWAGWDTHKQAEENIESFANDYKFCPGCGAEMEGGVYVQ